MVDPGWDLKISNMFIELKNVGQISLYDFNLHMTGLNVYQPFHTKFTGVFMVWYTKQAQ